MGEVPRRTSLVPLAFPCSVLCLIGVETERLLAYQGRAEDHFHCTVEPSPGRIRCRISRVISGKNLSFPEMLRLRIPSKITKANFRGLIFVVISRQRVVLLGIP